MEVSFLNGFLHESVKAKPDTCKKNVTSSCFYSALAEEGVIIAG
jgi:hypothetical protein